MVVVELKGGLGNQMFQWAAGRSLASRLGAELFLDDRFLTRRHRIRRATPRSYSLGVFGLEIDALRPPADVLRRFTSRRNTARNLLLPGGPAPWFRERGPRFDPRFYEQTGDVYLSGYWQSPHYFDAVAAQIRQDFVFEAPLTDGARAMLAKIESGLSVCVHVRRGDYVNDPKTRRVHGICGLPYYVQALERLQSEVGAVRAFVFSDDLAWCEAHLDLPAEVTFVGDDCVGEGASSYLTLMQRCSHFVIANSTFSWWPAWLSESSEKRVLVPTPWFNTGADTTHLIPAGWTALPKQDPRGA